MLYTLMQLRSFATSLSFCLLLIWLFSNLLKDLVLHRLQTIWGRCSGVVWKTPESVARTVMLCFPEGSVPWKQFDRWNSGWPQCMQCMTILLMYYTVGLRWCSHTGTNTVQHENQEVFVCLFARVGAIDPPELCKSSSLALWWYRPFS